MREEIDAKLPFCKACVEAMLLRRDPNPTVQFERDCEREERAVRAEGAAPHPFPIPRLSPPANDVLGGGRPPCCLHRSQERAAQPLWIVAVPARIVSESFRPSREANPEFVSRWLAGSEEQSERGCGFGGKEGAFSRETWIFHSWQVVSFVIFRAVPELLDSSLLSVFIKDLESLSLVVPCGVPPARSQGSSGL